MSESNGATPKKTLNMFDNITNVELDFSMYDKSEYSFNKRITSPSQRSLLLTIFNTFRSFVAIGILSLPFAIKMVGPILGFLGIFIVGIIVFLGTQALLEVADDSKFKGANYEILGKLLWGKTGEHLIVVLLAICAISVFIGGVLFTVDFLDFAFCSHGV